MRKFLILLLCVMCYVTHAQQCENGLYNFKEGATWELANFDKKDKPTGHTTFTFSKISVSDSTFKGNLQSISYDEKEKQLTNTELSVQCKNGDILIDMESIISEKQMESYRNGEFVIIKQDELFLPKSIEIGQKLPNGKLSGELDTDDGAKAAKVSYETTERSVLAKESIAVPAGTFECYKISSKIHSVAIVAGISLNIDYVLVEWYAYGAGIVRSEVYKKDKLESYSVLTKSSK